MINSSQSKGKKMKKIIGLALFMLFSAHIQAGDIAKGQAKSGTCASCHSADGNSAIATNPKLAGQGEKYLIKQLQDFKSKARDNGIMFGMASLLNDDDIANVAAYYSSQKIQHAAVADEYIKTAEKIYRGGDTDRDIPACIACHGAKGNGISTAGFPAIGGQHPEYTIATLKAFRSGARSNDINGVMQDIVAKMSDKQIEALGHYLVGLH